MPISVNGFLRMSDMDIKKLTPDNGKKCFNCDFYKFKCRDDGPWGFCEKLEKWFPDDWDLSQKKCKEWK